MNTNKETMQKKYKIFSVIYDNIFDVLENIVFMETDKNPRIALSKRIQGEGEGLFILDVCSGTGKGSIALAETNNTIIGIDISPHMLTLANKKILKRGIKHISFMPMDVRKMDFPSNTFDIEMVSFGLHEMEYELMMVVLKEMHRTLKKGGKLFILDYGKEDRFFLKQVFSIYLYLSYPEHVQRFLEYDWNKILTDIGFRLDEIQACTISQIICATKL
ncbi:MAG: class I SAM-dependent methyltransferase [Desulfobacterales bacterium]|nr:class I SAM-dependent methyltransferase [Desulfobacterales bacterium]